MRSEKEESERFKRAVEPLDFSPPSTAVDPESAAQDTTEEVKTGRHAYTENATFTDERIGTTDRKSPGLADPVENASEDPRFYTSLNELNRSFYADEDTHIETERRRQDNLNDLQMWGRQIGLSDHEIQRGLFILGEIHEDSPGHQDDALILGTLTVVANEDHGSHAPKILRETSIGFARETDLLDVHHDLVDTYKQIRTDCNVTTSEIKAVRQYIRELM